MSWARFPKEDLMKAKAEGKAAIIVGYAGQSGRNEAVFRVAEDDGVALWALAMAINLKLMTDEELAGVRGLVEAVYARAKAKREAQA